MNIRTLASTVVALASAPVFALTPSPESRIPRAAEVIVRMESRYPGEVVAIELDASGDKRAHFHVDMVFPGAGLARVDVDAATLALASRETTPLEPGAATLTEAVALVAAQLPGQVITAALDSSWGVPPHYDIDVRLPHGATARVRIDPETRQIAWRSPAIVDQ